MISEEVLQYNPAGGKEIRCARRVSEAQGLTAAVFCTEKEADPRIEGL